MTIKQQIKGTKFSVKEINKPTPKWISVIINILSVIGGTLTATGLESGNKVLGFIALGSTALAQILGKCFGQK